MAFIPTDDKQLDPNDPNAQQQSGQPNIAGSAGFNGPQSSSTVGSGTGVSTAGVGRGGTGGWTNIQAYINANKDYNSGAEKAIREQGTNQVNQERSKIDQEANQVKSQVDNQANQVNDVKQNYGSWINQGAQNYQYGAQNQNQNYNDYFNKLKGALNMQYQGPDQVSYQRSADTQRYADAVADDGAYRNLVNDFYKKQGGGKLSSGQRALQDQLDVNNTGLQNARKDLQGQFQGLSDYETQKMGDINNQITQAKETIGNFDFRNLLANDAARLNQSIAEQEAAAKNAYETAYRGGSGRKAAGFDALSALTGQGSNLFSQPTGTLLQNQRRDSGVWGDNLTFEQLQREASLANQLSGGLDQFKYYDPIVQHMLQQLSPGAEDPRAALAGNQDYLNQWYGQQDAKYGNTADAEERQWNLIADLLGYSDPRKEEGFKVRG